MAYSAPSTRSTGGLITAAIWNQDVVANPIAIYAGAMSISSQAIGDLLVPSSTTQIGRVADVATGSVLVSGGVGAAPAYSASPSITGLTLSTELAVASGGTGLDTLTNANLLVGAGTSDITFIAPGSANNVLVSNGSAWAGSAPIGVASGGTGRSSLTSASVLVGDGTSAVAYVAPGSSGNVLKSNGSAWSSGALAAAGMTILVADNGTHTATSDAIVDSIAISGLTDDDRLMWMYWIDCVTQNMTGVASIKNTTDSVTIRELATGSMNAGQDTSGIGFASQRQASATVVGGYNRYSEGGSQDGGGGALTFSTAWTGSWTLGLNMGAMTSGGTAKWTWAVWKLAGQ